MAILDTKPLKSNFIIILTRNCQELLSKKNDEMISVIIKKYGVIFIGYETCIILFFNSNNWDIGRN
jgi:hypothetical protein